MEITRLWRLGSGEVYAAEVTSPAGGKYTAGLKRGEVTWAESEVWARPKCHGLERWFCPGHNGAVCQYGACDEIRVTDLTRLRILVAAFQRHESGALVAN